MPRYCFIQSCRETNYKNPNRKLVRFPKNTKTFLCDKHFPSNFFGKKKLKEASYEKIKTILKENGINIPVARLADKITQNKRKYSRRCVVKHCQLTDTSTEPRLKFVIFPKKDSELYDVWVRKCNLSKDERTRAYKYVCEKHFLDRTDRVPNCNLTSVNPKRTYQSSKFIEGTPNENMTTDASQEDRFQQNVELSGKSNSISTFTVTLIENIVGHRQSIKEEPELLIDDDFLCDDPVPNQT